MKHYCRIISTTIEMPMRKKRDFELLRNIIKFYSFTGTFPHTQKSVKLCLLAYYIVGITYFVEVYLNFLKLSTFSSLGIVLNTSTVTLMLAFSILCLYEVFHQEIVWKSFFIDLKTFDSMLESEGIILEDTVYKYYFKFIITNTFYVVTYSSFILTPNTRNFQKIVGTSFAFLMNMQILLTTLTSEKCFMIIAKRYDCVKSRIRETYTSPNVDKNWNCHQLEILHLLLINMVNKVNELFGQRILIILLMLLLDVLGSFQLAFFEKVQEEPTHTQEVIRRCIRSAISLASIFRSCMKSYFTPYQV